ncbi:insulinase family protein [Cellulosilyticum ruminicola]|uniref:insulinase family protein n=1 Tax=Cellulosilyticum ruminicola TaxID=425254 RepID=UPI0006CF93DB|nr:insulinase family protein [Cellulosilyticum ruminicola]
MDLQLVQQYKGFKLLQEEYIEEVEGIGRVLRHERTGATIINVSNNDPHKVFCVVFRTPPENNKGIPHIIEHTVCCASKEYALNETFMALEKGSVCTALNACTYPDMTMYYGASLSEKDLNGIMKVYMDMVFQPLIKEDARLFAQEGWHYTVDEETQALGVSGVVYHEMQGEYGEATTRLEHALSKALFKDTHYRFDAGGIPQDIISLSYEDLWLFMKNIMWLIIVLFTYMGICS